MQRLQIAVPKGEPQHHGTGVATALAFPMLMTSVQDTVLYTPVNIDLAEYLTRDSGIGSLPAAVPDGQGQRRHCHTEGGL